MSNIYSLKKLEFNSLPQFIEDLNSNLAVIENSPLFKGVSGEPGLDGDKGAKGVRGSRFLFVNIDRFIEVFNNEVNNGSEINEAFINNKLVNFNQKTLLLEAFNVSEIVHQDVIVFSDSSMYTYNQDENIIINTGQAFNPESNFLNNIEQTIERIVQQAIDNNSAINNISNIFNSFKTLGKNYADDNSIIGNDLTQSSIYSPHIAGYNNNVGVEIPDHNYFGYADDKFPLGHRGTMVYGSIKKFYKLLMATVSVDGNQTLTSDYAPGVNNIPSIVMLQDTYNNGFYFGYKDKNNLKSFGSIYKNDQNEVVIKSDSSKKLNEYSELLIHKDYMKYGKQVFFGDNLQVTKNLSVLGAINNELIRTSSFTSGTNNINNVEIGKSNAGVTNIQSSTVKLEQYKSVVIVTDINGNTLKTYRVETLPVPTVTDLNLYNIGSIPSSANNILTSNYFNLLANRFNSLSSYISINYWRKNQFNTGEIPDLKLSNSLTLSNKLDIGGKFIVDKSSDTTSIKTNKLDIFSGLINFKSFIKKVLVTDGDGNLVQTHEIETANPSYSINENGVFTGLTNLPNTNNILTTKYYNLLLGLISSQNSFNNNNYWRKNQFDTGIIPKIRVSGSIQGSSLIIDGSVEIDNQRAVFKKPTIFNSDVILTDFSDTVLVTDINGKVLNKYKLFTGFTLYNLIPNINTSNNVQWNKLEWKIGNINPESASGDYIVKYPTIKTIIDGLNQFVNWCLSNFYRRDQYNTGEIPAIKVTSSLSSNSEFYAGALGNRNIEVNGAVTKIGKVTGSIDIRGIISLNNYTNSDFISTDSNGNIVNNKSVSTVYPKWAGLGGGDDDSWHEAESNNNHAFTTNLIRNDFYNDNWENVWLNVDGNGSTIEGFYNHAAPDVNKILNHNHFNYLWNHIKNINQHLLKNFVTHDKLQSQYQRSLPIGSIIAWDSSVMGSSYSAHGFYVCDGRNVTVNGVNYTTPDLVDCFLEGVNPLPKGNTPARTPGHNPETNTKMLQLSNLPTEILSVRTTSDGTHSHIHDDTYLIENNAATGNVVGNRIPGALEQVIVSNTGNGVFGVGMSDGDNNRRYYLRRTTSAAGSHHHDVNFALNSFKTGLNIKPKSYRVFYLIKLHN